MDRKIGEGHLGAMFRLGLKELRNAMNPSRDSVADSEIGLYGTLTQGEIADARGGPGQGPEQESREGTMSLEDFRAYAKEMLESEAKAKEQGKEQGQDRSQDHGKDQDRGDLER